MKAFPFYLLMLVVWTLTQTAVFSGRAIFGGSEVDIPVLGVVMIVTTIGIWAVGWIAFSEIVARNLASERAPLLFSILVAGGFALTYLLLHAPDHSSIEEAFETLALFAGPILIVTVCYFVRIVRAAPAK